MLSAVSAGPRNNKTQHHQVLGSFFGGANQSRTGLTGFAIRGITALLSRRVTDKKGKLFSFPFLKYGAGNEARTRDLNLGKVALYQLSYSRVEAEIITLFLLF